MVITLQTENIIDCSNLIDKVDFLFITLDSLRYDVAMEAFKQNLTPELNSILPRDGWEKRHSIGNFTVPTHFAFFNGFLPTPAEQGSYEYTNVIYVPRVGEDIRNSNMILNPNNIISGLAEHGYLTICIGGVGFFNNKAYLGKIFTQYFMESYWTHDMGIFSKKSTEVQVETAIARLDKLDDAQRIVLFLNVCSTHEPTNIFVDGARKDSPETQKAALIYSDKYIGKLIKRMRTRSDVYAIIFSDHGDAFGEGGLYGHRNSHPVVMIIPYMQGRLKRI